MKRIVLGMLALWLVAVPPMVMAQSHGPCTVTGFVYWNGNKVGANEHVQCQGHDASNPHALLKGDADTEANGFYSCYVADKGDGHIHTFMRSQDLGHCPTQCTGSTITCDVYGSGTCQNASATLALLLPPTLYAPIIARRARRRRDSRSDA